jgi:rRNA maturation endonuclease Nob1
MTIQDDLTYGVFWDLSMCLGCYTITESVEECPECGKADPIKATDLLAFLAAIENEGYP